MNKYLNQNVDFICFSDKHADKPAMKASRRMLDMAGVHIRQFVPSGKITIDFDIINKK